MLCGILHVLHHWEDLPQGLGFGSGMVSWRRLRDWNEASVWQLLPEAILPEQKRGLVTGLVLLCGRLLPCQSPKRVQHTGPSPVDRGRARSRGSAGWPPALQA